MLIPANKSVSFNLYENSGCEVLLQKGVGTSIWIHVQLKDHLTKAIYKDALKWVPYLLCLLEVPTYASIQDSQHSLKKLLKTFGYWPLERRDDWQIYIWPLKWRPKPDGYPTGIAYGYDERTGEPYPLFESVSTGSDCS